MRTRCFSIYFLICQLLVSSIYFGYIAAEEIDCTEPVDRVSRAIWPDMLTEEYKRAVIDRLMSYFRRPSTVFGEVIHPIVLAEEGTGQLTICGDDIYANGLTDVEGTVPFSGTVTFTGPVRASGSVTITGRCAPASGSSPCYFGKQVLPPPLTLSPTQIFPQVPVKTPVTEVLPSLQLPSPPIQRVIPIIEQTPTPVPTIILPPVVIPTGVIPAYVFSEVTIPDEVLELATGFGNFVVTGNDVVTNGEAYIDGIVPINGDVTFSGCVSAKGSVTIYSCF